MKTATYPVLTFAELNDAQKAKALDHYRDLNTDHHDWYEFTFEDAKTVGALLGFNIKNVHFSGFWSQGDGACFTGRFSYPGKGLARAVREHAPEDKTLHRIAKAAQDLYAASFYTASGTVAHRGHYYHERSMDLSLTDHGQLRGRCLESEWRDLAASFAKWIYGQLEGEYEYQTGDEAVTEAIEASGYEFEIEDDGSIRF